MRYARISGDVEPGLARLAHAGQPPEAAPRSRVASARFPGVVSPCQPHSAASSTAFCGIVELGLPATVCFTGTSAGGYSVSTGARGRPYAQTSGVRPASGSAMVRGILLVG